MLDLNKGKEKDRDDPRETGIKAAVEAAVENTPYLMRVKMGSLAKILRKRFDRHDKDAKLRNAELKVNLLRYEGTSFAQVDPKDPTNVYMPPGANRRSAPSDNRIPRTVDRYAAQVTADDPVMEATPASHDDEDRDAAEAATIALRGEWERMNLNGELKRTMMLAAVYRSAFWHFEYDKFEGGMQPAQKFKKDEFGRPHLQFVDGDGNFVDSIDDAKKIRMGATTVEVLTPFNVRWSGHRYAHRASEVMVAKLPTLRDVLATYPMLRDHKIIDIMSNVPKGAKEWLQDLRAESDYATGNAIDDMGDLETKTAGDIGDTHRILDEPVFMLRYYQRPNATYPKGFQATTVGSIAVHRGVLRYGVVPVAHFKFLDDIRDRCGRGLVDILRDPQELYDFVNGQILRFLQTLRRRWFVPNQSGITARDLLNPTRSIIKYNPAAGQPIPETQPEIPNSLVEWVDRFKERFDDEAGMHDTLQGKHVPGVSSGRHAEALRTGDETMLGLTRQQIVEGLEAAAVIMLAVMQREWSIVRRVRYFGDDRMYIDRAFANTDFGDTRSVTLKRGTLLMLTPAQKTETLFSYVQMGALTDPTEIRSLAPLLDTAGISTSESAHYQRARTQNRIFLDGPPDRLLTIHKEIAGKLEILEEHAAMVSENLIITTPEDASAAMARIEQDVMELQEEWQSHLDNYMPDHRPWEDNVEISRIHAVVHSEALASDKATRLPEWWVEAFEQHATLEWQKGYPEQQQPVDPNAGTVPQA